MDNFSADSLAREQEAFVDSVPKMLRTPSQKSISTDEGSSSSGCSSSPLASDLSSCSLPQCGGQHRSPVNLAGLGCNRHAPLWVDNGLKGDGAAWLLVMPKIPAPTSDVADGCAPYPKSPKDAVLLGPYVKTKNTFLDEARIGESLEFRQRARAKSAGASH